jgi:hypothetical protein
MKNWLRRILVWLVVLVIFAWSPVLWLVLPNKSVRILVIDKTVTDHDYREHASLFWVLNHEKTVPPGQTRPWSIGRDYIGYFPAESPECFGAYLPLSPDELQDIDLLYIADAYGVSTEEMYDCTGGDNPFVGRSGLGGFDVMEVSAIETFIAGGGMVVGESSTFGGLTTGVIRYQLSILFGVITTDWVGRYVEELNNPDEVPLWARQNYEALNGNAWGFNGPGIMLVNDDQRIVILEANRDVAPGGLPIHNLVDDPLLDGTVDDVPFLGWFDIVEAVPESQVLAEFRLELTESGASKADTFGIPDRFPAIVRISSAPLRLYFSGDFSDNSTKDPPYYMSGWSWARKAGYLGGDVDYEKAFHWRYYVPLITNIIAAAEQAVGE